MPGFTIKLLNEEEQLVQSYCHTSTQLNLTAYRCDFCGLTFAGIWLFVWIDRETLLTRLPDRDAVYTRQRRTRRARILPPPRLCP